jgi:hypothetical protein
MAGAALRMADSRGIRAMEIIMRHAGVTGMIAGQAADLLSEGEPPREDLVIYIHSHKTADLLEAPIEAGLALAGADEQACRLGREYGYHLGLAFQMTDDLLDVEGNLGEPDCRIRLYPSMQFVLDTESFREFVEDAGRRMRADMDDSELSGEEESSEEVDEDE